MAVWLRRGASGEGCAACPSRSVASGGERAGSRAEWRSSSSAGAVEEALEALDLGAEPGSLALGLVEKVIKS